MAIVKQLFSVIDNGQVCSDGWTTRAAAVRMCESQHRYSRAIGQACNAKVYQGGYDSDDGERMVRNVYPKRSAWRLV